MIPKDPFMLLSYINTQLRDHYDSLEALGEGLDADVEEIVKTLQAAGYTYSPKENRFRIQ